MKLFKKKLVLFAITAFFITANAQETFILNYDIFYLHALNIKCPLYMS